MQMAGLAMCWLASECVCVYVGCLTWQIMADNKGTKSIDVYFGKVVLIDQKSIKNK